MPTEPPQAKQLSRAADLARPRQRLIESKSPLEPGALSRPLSAQLHGLGAGSVDPLREGNAVEEELIQDPQRLSAIVEALVVNESSGYVIGSGRTRRGKPEKIPARVTRDGCLLLECGPRGGRLPRPPFEVELDGWNSVYQFRSSRDGTIEVPELMIRSRKRRHRRVPAPRRFRVAFAHVSLPEGAIDAPAIDVSLEGVAIDTSAAGDALEPGLPLAGVELYWKGGVRLKTDAVVAHVTRATQHSVRVGLRLLMEPHVLEEWHRQIEGVLHPRTTRGAENHDLFWQTYVRSGYFNLSRKNEADFEVERPAFVRSHELLRGAPEIGASFVRASEKRVEAVAHQISPWPNSWLFYQFCRRPDARPASVADDNVLMDIYAHAYEYVQQRPGAEWLVTYVQEVARFSRLIFHELGQRYAAIGRASVTRFRAIEVDGTIRSEPDPRFDVGLATRAELRAVATAVQSLRPRMYVEATGLAAPELGIDDTIEQWSAAGLKRGRGVVVARENGKPVACAVLDAADDGLHLFGLLDVARFYPLREGGEEAFEALLGFARSWFLELGKHRFAYFADEAEHPDAASAPGCTDLGAAFTIVLPTTLLPELLEHVYATTFRRAKPARARASRSSRPAQGSVVNLRAAPPSKLPPKPEP